MTLVVEFKPLHSQSRIESYDTSIIWYIWTYECLMNQIIETLLNKKKRICCEFLQIRTLVVTWFQIFQWNENDDYVKLRLHCTESCCFENQIKCMVHVSWTCQDQFNTCDIFCDLIAVTSQQRSYWGRFQCFSSFILIFTFTRQNIFLHTER